MSIPVSTYSDQWIAAEVLRDDFIHTQSVDDVQPEVDEAGEATTLLFAHFIGFVTDHIRATPEDISEDTALLTILLRAISHFTATLLSDIDIHSLIALYEHKARMKVLSTFYVTCTILMEYAIKGTPKLTTPFLLAEMLSGCTSIFALFDGQDINEIYFNELQTLFDTYHPLVEPFLASVIDKVLQPLASTSQGTSFYEHGLNNILWLTGAVFLSLVDYLASVPVSFPLIGLTQFTQ